MQPEVFELTKPEIVLLENTLESKISMIYKSFGIMVLVVIAMIIFQSFKEDGGSVIIPIIVGLVIYCPFFCILYFGSMSKIKKDLDEKKKIKFKAKVTDKASDEVLGIQESSIFLENNAAGITKVNVEKNVLDKIPLFSYIIVSVAVHSKTYVGCEILNE
jgi:hypothetical protein